MVHSRPPGEHASPSVRLVALGALVQQTSRAAADTAGAIARLPNLILLLERALQSVADARLAELPDRLDQLMAAVGRIEERMDDALPSMRATVENVGRDLDSVTSVLAGLVGDLSTLGAQVGSLSEDLLRVLRWVPKRKSEPADS